jgi:hypothetical protein
MSIHSYNNLTFEQVQQYFPDEPVLSVIRHYRDHLLVASDWAMSSDAPTDKQAWADYRQALRDFPATWTPGPTVVFPPPPA